jgi:hypothetical protein
MDHFKSLIHNTPARECLAHLKISINTYQLRAFQEGQVLNTLQEARGLKVLELILLPNDCIKDVWPGLSTLAEHSNHLQRTRRDLSSGMLCTDDTETFNHLFEQLEEANEDWASVSCMARGFKQSCKPCVRTYVFVRSCKWDFVISDENEYP